MKRLIVGAMLSLAILICGCGKKAGAMSETAATKSGEAGGAAKEGEEETADKELAEEEKGETVNGEECYEQTNRINQTFVDTIRKDGGNNEQRFF